MFDEDRIALLGHERPLIETLLEDGLDALVGRRLDRQGAHASGFQPLGAEVLAQSQQSQT